jgi:Ca2+-binding EF-hand superfamily protein
VSPRIIASRSHVAIAQAALRASGLLSTLALLAVIVGLPSLPATEPASTKADTKTATKSEAFDVAYLSDVRPIVVRLQIISDGKPLQEAWNCFADALFAKLDLDKNGTIDEKELTNLRPMLALLTGQFTRTSADPASASRRMNRDQFGEYLKKNDLGPVRITSLASMEPQNPPGLRRAGTPTPEELDKTLLELLDTNKDGKISVAEFTAGIEILSKLDADENELVTVEEIMRRPLSPYFIQDPNFNQEPPSPGVELFPLAQKGTDANLARRMLIRYGPKPAAGNQNQGRNFPRRQQVMQQTEPTVRRLTKKDLKLSDEIFAALDQDGDDELDTEELARFGQNAKPEVEITIRLGKLASGVKAAEVISGGKAPLKVFASARGSEVAIEVPGLRLDFVSPASSGRNYRNAFRSFYLNQFRDLDADANGYLDKKEVANDQLFRDLFPFLDKDGDGKIFEKELTAALDDVEKIASIAANGIVSIELSEASRGIFGLIDADGDGKLSISELRAMPKLVERFGSKKDGALGPGDVPRRFEALLTPGLGAGRVSYAPQNAYMGMPNASQRPQVGPLWFQKMDRNRDGYVSRREFLGTDEEFRKLDLNGDGLISVEEAEAAEVAGNK